MLPAQYGGQKAIAHFNQHLAKLVPLVMLCSRSNRAKAANYKVLPLLPKSKLQFLNPLVWRTIYRVAKQEKATHLVLEFPYHALAGWWCKRLLGVRLVINTHNIEYLRFREQGRPWWRLLFYYEQWALRTADAMFFKTERDKAVAQRLFNLKVNKLSVVPYGVLRPSPTANADLIVRKRHAIPNNHALLLFAATLDYAPNAHAVRTIYERLVPLLDRINFPYTMLITGRNRQAAFQHIKRYKHPKALILDEVEDIESYLQGTDVFVSPVLTGGGVQTKLMDAIAHGLPTVCFASKAVGIEGANGKLHPVADGDWSAFADAIVKACGERQPTPEAFFKKYDWRTIAATAVAQLKANA